MKDNTLDYKELKKQFYKKQKMLNKQDRVRKRKNKHFFTKGVK
ncbi:MAG: hypothetical protein R3321_08825 [Nitrososphaeraceae archaeon]|nr:hypothetical protein [Nitrososphaeraceae archaeon]